MCNDYGNRIAYSTYVEEFSHLRLPLILPTAAPNLEPRDDIWPTEVAPIIRRHGNGIELAQLRWGFPPGRPKAPPVINFRSDSDGASQAGDALFQLRTSSSSPAQSRRNRSGALPSRAKNGSALRELWRTAQDDVPASFTLLTTQPGPDVAPIHDRQMVVLERDDWSAWLDLTRPEGELLRPLPQGSLVVEQVR